MFFVCRKHKVIISGQKCKWYFIYWTLLNNLWTPFYIYINIYILTFKAMNNSQCFPTSDLVSMQNRRCFWSGFSFFSPSLERRSRNILNTKQNTENWTIEKFEGINDTVRLGDDWMSLQTHTWAAVFFCFFVFLNQWPLWLWRSLLLWIKLVWKWRNQWKDCNRPVEMFEDEETS